MPTYYIDPVNGNDADDGLSWANAFLTLNGAEDEPVAAGDLVYVGPGVYREQLEIDVDGTPGNPIIYVGDVTGEHTNGVGGIVRLTGSDNDQTATRQHCIDNVPGDGDYRTFRGFTLDSATLIVVDIDGADHWIFEDCVFQNGQEIIIRGAGADCKNHIIRRCLFLPSRVNAVISFSHGGGVEDSGILIENCVFLSNTGPDTITFNETGDPVIRNCLFMTGVTDVIDMITDPPVGHPCIVENCSFVACGTALESDTVAGLVEDFNNFHAVVTARQNVNVGGNSQSFIALLRPPILHSGAGQVSGFKFPWWFGELSEWSAIRAITGNNEPTEDFWGIARPATASKNSWGPLQFQDYELESGTVQAGTYARVLHDAGQVLARRIPVTGVEITVTLYMRREANYAGNLPRMIIKQPGAADQIDTMVAAVNTWEQLSITFTPDSPPGFVEVWAESRNTAAAGNYETFYDTMGVS